MAAVGAWAGRLSCAVGVAWLAACNPFEGYAPTRAEIVADRIAVGEVAEQPGLIYCYRTLAKPECRSAPEAGEADRLVSHDGGNVVGPAR